MLKKTISLSIVSLLYLVGFFNNIGWAGHISYLFDNNGKLLEKVSSAGMKNVYQYDQNGNMIKAIVTNNILRNNGFEVHTTSTGVADGWSYWKPPEINGEAQVVTTPVDSGGRAQKLSASYIPQGEEMVLSQDAVLITYKPFNASVRVYMEQFHNANVTLSASFYDANDTYISNAWSGYGESRSGYVTMSASGTVPGNAAYARLHVLLGAQAGGGSGTVYVDSASLIYDTDNNLIANSGF